MRRHDLYKRGRGSAATCLSFGANRKVDFPNCFFCNGCDLLEDMIINSTRKGIKANRQMKKYACTGGHDDISHPVTLKNEYRVRRSATSTPQSAERGRCLVAGGDEDAFTSTSSTIQESTATRTKKIDKRSKKSPTASMRSPRKKKRRRQRPKLVVGILL
jgi:hypothetical protein